MTFEDGGVAVTGTVQRGNGGAIRVGLVQINNSFSGQNYIPLSVAMLESYARANMKAPGRVTFDLPIYRRTAVSEAVDDLHGAAIVGFSVYVWNFQISLEIARRLKSRDPSVLIVFGGPHVTDRGTEFLEAHSQVDIAVHGEGEQTFTEILDAFDAKDWAGIDGISYRAPSGEPTRNKPRIRFRNLGDVPSPFLDGTIDRLVAAKTDENWIGLWETNRGCPFRCTFCDWGSATGDRVATFEGDRISQEIQWFSANRIEFIFCCDANFGIKKRDVEIATEVAAVKEKTGYPKALSVQNTKNATERAYQTQKILSDAGLNKGVALSMQSLDPETLQAIKRDNISLETYFELQRRFTLDRVETYSDLILGMPGETYDSYVDGVCRLIESGQHNRIQFNNLSILPNAEMGDPAYQRRFGMETVRSEIVNIHGQKVDLSDDVVEFQELVVATHALPRAEWRRVRVFSWVVALLYFDKLLQIPLLVARHAGGVPFRDLFEAFMAVDPGRFPILGSVIDQFHDQAASIQAGGYEYVFSEQWLGIYWPQDEYAYIDLATRGVLDDFVAECTQLIEDIVIARGAAVPVQSIRDAGQTNAVLIKRPGAVAPVELTLDFDVLAFYRAARVGGAAALEPRPTRLRIDRTVAAYDDVQDWCREVVWWGNKKGAYLYSNTQVTPQLAGHF